MLQIEFTQDAIADMRSLQKHDQQQIVGAVERQLRFQAIQETRNRKRLRPNRLAELELRVGDFRVFYDVDAGGGLVKVEAVGRKVGNKLFVHGEEYEL